MTATVTRRQQVDERLRIMQVYDVLMRYGAEQAFGNGLVGSVRHGMQRRLWDEPDLEPLPPAVKLRLLLEELGPTYVKFGQIVSSRADALPAEFQDQLARLQSDVPPFSVDEAREQIAAELGAPVEELYETFDPKPLAAASLGQVHRATLHDGREVAVKVQRPNIEKRIQSDLLILARVARVAERRSPAAAAMGVSKIVAEFGSTLLLELDYTLEAFNARKLARNLEGLPGVRVPEIIADRSSMRVLTMEFVRGVPANDRDAIIACGIDPIEVADNAIRAALKMLLVDGFFHADPHPGNVLVDTETGAMTFLDAGMVGELSIRHRLNLIGLLLASNDADPLALAQSLRTVSEPIGNQAPDPRRFDSDFARRIGPLLDVPAGQKVPMGRIFSSGMDVLRDNGYRLDPQLALAIKSLTQAEQFMRVLYPRERASEFAERAATMTRELVKDNLTEERVVGYVKQQAMYAAREAAQQLPSLEEATRMWLGQYRRGRFEVSVDTSSLAPHIERMRETADGVSLAVVLVGVLIASAVAADVSLSGEFARLHDVAVVGYAGALVVTSIFAFVLIARMLRRRRAGVPGRM